MKYLLGFALLTFPTRDSFSSSGSPQPTLEEGQRLASKLAQEAKPLLGNAAALSGFMPVRVKERTFENPDCAASGTCSLKKIYYRVTDYSQSVPGDPEPNWGTQLLAHYETDALLALEDYLFVQFIRGCHFETVARGEAPAQASWSVSRQSFGDMIIFRQPDWMVDSMDTDPAYYTDNEVPELRDQRHYFYRWNSVPGSFANRTESRYGRQKPTHPALYVKDLPGQAFFSVNAYDPELKQANNISLKFKMCLYKAKDVPRESTPENLDFPNAIDCHDWASSFIYNWDKKAYESREELDPFCFSPLPVSVQADTQPESIESEDMGKP